MPAYTGYDLRLKLGSNFCFRRMKKKTTDYDWLRSSTFPSDPSEQDKSSMVRKKGTEKQGEPFQEDSRRDGSVGTLRLGPWHPEGQPTCRAQPLGIDTTLTWLIVLPLITNAALCTWPTSRQKKHNIPASHTSPLLWSTYPLAHIAGGHLDKTTIGATCTSSNWISFPISFGTNVREND